VEYKNNGVAENANVPTTQLATEFTPQNLSEDQIDDLVAFLENGLKDPDLFRYQPSSVASGNCFPNNDEMSQIDLGCE
jgi:cytochrome c peroxidase